MGLVDDVKAKLCYWAYKPDEVELDAILAPLAEAVECWELAERLTAEAFTAIEISDSESCEGVYSILCWGIWTRHVGTSKHEGHVFTGPTRLSALRAAVKAKEQANGID